jgi:DNA polymerase I-like protein with 3'-5' exonuclease and polymerase domains
MTLILDAEWTTIAPHRIHMVGVYNTSDSTYSHFSDRAAFIDYMSRHKQSAVAGHRLVFADVPMIRDRWGYDLREHVLVDTYTLSTMWRPGYFLGDHSLGAWGKRLKDYKGEFTDFDEPAEGETRDAWQARMAVYMKQDVMLTLKLLNHLSDKLDAEGFSQSSVLMEQQVARIVQEQIENGFFFDIEKATSLYVMLTARRSAKLSELQIMFPPLVEERWSEKTGKRLKDNVIEFNPASRQQVAARLVGAGVKLKDRTEPSKSFPNGQWKINEEILEKIPHPAAQLVAEYMMLEKRIGQLDQWFEYYNEDTHRIHGKVNPIGTNTRRQSQSRPNLAQIPSLRKPYGKECRELFTVPENCKLVGIDASALELRLFANRLGSEEYREVVTTGDVHTYNMEAAGLENRDQAKTFIYAFLYGAGVRRIAGILGCSEKAAKQTMDRFASNIPGFRKFKASIEEAAARSGITLIDGSKIQVEEKHKILNYQLQGDGAVAMKQALVNFYPDIRRNQAKLVVQAHDEWQIETPYHCCDVIGELGVKAIEKVTDDFDMFVPLTGEYQIGRSWADTH